MKQLLVCCMVYSFACVGFAQEKVLIHDPNARMRTVSGFSAIEVQHGIDLYLSQGSQEAIAVSAAKPDFRDKIKCEVREGVLHLWYEDKALFNNAENKKLKAYITVSTLRRIRASGGSDVYVAGTLKQQDLELQMSGASEFRGKVSCTDLKIANSGASGLEISGDAQNTTIDLGGASDFKGYDFTTASCDIHATGASDVKITVSRELRVQATGASHIFYRGQAVEKNVHVSGASTVRRRS